MESVMRRKIHEFCVVKKECTYFSIISQDLRNFLALVENLYSDVSLMQ